MELRYPALNMKRVHVQNSNRAIVAEELGKLGFPLKSIGELAQHTGVNPVFVFHVQKDVSNKVCVFGIPHSDVVFVNGLLCVYDDIALVVDREVAVEWGILARD